MPVIHHQDMSVHLYNSCQSPTKHAVRREDLIYSSQWAWKKLLRRYASEARRIACAFLVRDTVCKLLRGL